MFVARRKTLLYLFSLTIMDAKKDTVSMNDLLEDITSRIDMLRAKKHARAYDIALWWEMERQLIASKYSIVDCTVTYKPPRRWRKRYHIPGRAFDLLLLIVCAISAVMALLK